MVKYLTKKEQEIMEVLWEADKPLLVSEIFERIGKKQVAKNSVLPLIRKLIDCGYIKVVGNIKVAKTKSRFYAPAMSIEEYIACQTQNLLKASHKRFKIGEFLSYFTNKCNKDEKLISDLKEFVENYKNSIDRG